MASPSGSSPRHKWEVVAGRKPRSHCPPRDTRGNGGPRREKDTGLSQSPANCLLGAGCHSGVEHVPSLREASVHQSVVSFNI